MFLERKQSIGPRLFVTEHVPEDAKAVVLLLHGYADHGARYAHVIQAWNERGIGVITVDLRGHGNSEGDRGYAGSPNDYLNDVAEAHLVLKNDFPNLPHILMGHSFGGLTAALYGLKTQKEWNGLLLSAPFLDLALEVPPLKRFVGELAAKYVPKLRMPSGFQGSDLSHDPQMAKAYDEDPLVFKKVNVKWFTVATEMQEEVRKKGQELELPLLVAFGSEDKLAKYEAGKIFIEKASSKDKLFLSREGEFHEILNEVNRETLISQMADWILKHTSSLGMMA